MRAFSWFDAVFSALTGKPTRLIVQSNCTPFAFCALTGVPYSSELAHKALHVDLYKRVATIATPNQYKGGQYVLSQHTIDSRQLNRLGSLSPVSLQLCLVRELHCGATCEQSMLALDFYGATLARMLYLHDATIPNHRASFLNTAVARYPHLNIF